MNYLFTTQEKVNSVNDRVRSFASAEARLNGYYEKIMAKRNIDAGTGTRADFLKDFVEPSGCAPAKTCN